MYQEYALDPDGLIEATMPKLLFELFGKDSGRMLASLQDPREWAIYIEKEIQRRKALGTIRPQQFLRIQALLEPLLKSPAARQEKFFPHHPKRGLYNASTSWRDNALRAHRAVPFAAIVTNDKGGTVAPDDIDPGDPVFALAPSVRVARSASALVDLLQSLISLSTKLVLIDPHFQPLEKRFQYLLPEIFNRYDHIKEAHIYLKENRFKPCTSRDFESWCAQDEGQDSLLLPGEKLYVSVLRERHRGEKLHARFVLTEIGGVAVDPGTDVDTRPNSGNTFFVTRLSSTIHQNLWREYVQESGFHVTERFTVECQP